MSKPFTKEQLLADMQKERTALEQYLEKLSPDLMTQSNVVGGWSAKDVLAHLIEWEQMVLGWYQTSLMGQKPTLPAEGYKWNQLPALNQHIYEKHHDRPLADILTQFRESYQQVRQTVLDLSEEALFTRGYYAWAGENAFASYLNSCTASHYRWARKEIRKGIQVR